MMHAIFFNLDKFISSYMLLMYLIIDIIFSKSVTSMLISS